MTLFLAVPNTLPAERRGDVGAQTRSAVAALAARLQAQGSSLERVAAVMVYLRRAEDFAGMNAAWASCWPHEPPARTTLVTRPSAPDALLELSATALPAGAPREAVLPAGWKPSPRPYSYAIRAGDTLFLSGLIARDPHHHGVAGATVGEQTRQVVANAEAILSAAGMNLADVVCARAFLPQVEQFEAFTTTYRGLLPAPRPARATVGAGLTGPEYRVEITFTAVRGAKETFDAPEPDGSPGRPNPNLSGAVRVGRRLYTAGFLGEREGLAGDPAGQTRVILRRLEGLLRAAGSSPAQVASGIVYVTDWSHREVVERELRAVLGRAPVFTWVETPLVPPDAVVEPLFEVEVE